MEMQFFYERRKTDDTSFDHRRLRIAKIIDRVNPSSVLDIGCGRGTLLAKLRNRLPGSRLVGCDISQGTINIARDSGFEAYVADISVELPFDDESFDCVVYGEVVEHVVDPDATLREIARILRPNGTLILTTPNIASWFNRILLFLGIQPIFTETSLYSNLGRHFSVLGQGKATQGHLKVFTLCAIVEMLKANGYIICSIAGATFPGEIPLNVVDKFFALFPTFASNFVIEARRGTDVGTRYQVVDDETLSHIDIPITWKSKKS